ncbi:hypothetical protein DMH03_36165 [Amycolatopsis sp. WAC 01376]|uniref:hypothetical protein n=1 Tax=Amycolatopsis sp. WAC 01376 TaxID=2203195 RepID=UPI000F79755B|nr:hypothetical protein [Amycolatopsis sp. WAC 01376]RSM54272.1 hypothetical protein DMH03_36165 [Amycolatopsis sp. WAC 01376]
MRSIEFRRFSDVTSRSAKGRTTAALELLIDGVSFLELVRRAELPDALAEQQERAEEFAPEPAPLLAGDYSPVTGCSAEHLLGEAPDDIPHGAEDDERLLLGCSCGIVECWALVVKIATDAETVTWSGLRNTYREWNYDAIGVLTFSRQQYEEALHAAFGAVGS